MNYKKNEQGEVAVRDAKGNLKYIAQRLAEDKQLMRAMHFEIIEAPEPFIIEERCESFPEEKGGIKSATLIDENGTKTEIDLGVPPNGEMSISYEKPISLDEIKTEVAETTPAKRVRKPNQQ